MRVQFSSALLLLPLVNAFPTGLIRTPSSILAASTDAVLAYEDFSDLLTNECYYSTSSGCASWYNATLSCIANYNTDDDIERCVCSQNGGMYTCAQCERTSTGLTTAGQAAVVGYYNAFVQLCARDGFQGGTSLSGGATVQLTTGTGTGTGGGLGTPTTTAAGLTGITITGAGRSTVTGAGAATTITTGTSVVFTRPASGTPTLAGGGTSVATPLGSGSVGTTGTTSAARTGASALGGGGGGGSSGVSSLSIERSQVVALPVLVIVVLVGL
ncbi:hypothetical protein T439DRAFT_330321 [Meredithblackwellia eburnea MCA 4105]